MTAIAAVQSVEPISLQATGLPDAPLVMAAQDLGLAGGRGASWFRLGFWLGLRPAERS